VTLETGLDPALAARLRGVQQVPALGPMPSRRSSLKLVALHTSAVTPKSAFSNSAAAITSRRIVPLPMSCTRSPFFAVFPPSLS